MDVIDLSQFIKFLLAFVFVLSLMGGLALIMRKLNGNNPVTLPHKKRLRIVEILPLDARRRLVLIRRDDREHLVILGANSETLIESDIESPQNKSAVNQTEDT